jgi:hypothetical protein
MRNLSGCDFYKSVRAIAHRDPWSEEIGLLVAEHVSGQPRRVAKPLEFVELPDGAPLDPTIRLAGMEAQELMDMLWDCGLRPTQSKSSIGQTEAIIRHLEDMRAVAFSKLEIPKP